MNLTEYAAALEKSSKPSDVTIARFIRTHEARLTNWVSELGRGQSRADREELEQVALLAITQAVVAPDVESALRGVYNALHRESRHAASWNTRRCPEEMDS